MATFNTAASSQVSVNSVVEFLIPLSQLKRNTESQIKYADKKEAEVISKREKLAKFFKVHSINALPNWSKICILLGGKDNAKVARLPKAFYQAMEVMGTQWFGARDKKDKGKDVRKGCKISLASIYKTTPWEEGILDLHYIKGCDLPKHLAIYLAKELSKLTPEQYAELISIFCSKAEVSGSIISIVGASGDKAASTKLLIDLKTKEVRSRTNRKANEIISIAKGEYDSKFALFVLAIQLANFTSSSRINTTLVELANLWEREDNYGAKMKATDPTRITLNHLCLPMTFEGAKRGVFPFIKIVNAKFDCSNINKFNCPVAIDKNAKQWMTLKKGAIAMMIGRNGDLVLNPHDGGKPAKEYNRPTQGMKFLKADSPNRVFSKLSIDLGDGTYAIPEGTMLMTAFTNSRLGAGSGVSFIKPGTTIDYEVEKTITGQVTTLRIPSAIRAKMANLPGGVFENLKTAVSLQCEKLVGKSFATGEVILRMFNGKYEVIRNDNHNQTLTVVAVDIIDLNSIQGRADSFQVKLTVKLSESDDCLKLRNMGVKLTTLAYPVKGLRDDWQLILNNETAKGKLGLVHLFANKYGATYYPNEGLLMLDEPCVVEGEFDKQIIDLKESSNAFTQWVKENTEETSITLPIAKSEWEVINKSHPDADDIKFISDMGNYVVVEEKIQVVYGYLPYEVEISTPRENTGTSSLTLEQLAALSLQNNELAETIWEESKEYQQTVKDLVANVLQTDMVTDNQFVLTTQVARQNLRSKFTEEFTSDRALMKALETAFPNGLILSAVYNDQDSFLYIKPKVLARMGTFFGKSASGISLDVISFFHYLLDAGMENEKGVDQTLFSWVEKLKKSVEAWMDSMSKSDGVMKKLGRTSKCLVNGKVKTTYHAEIEPTQGLPISLLHPDCAMVKLLDVNEGDVVGIGRTPMPFVTCCVVKLSTVGREGHMMVSPSIWSAGNEGDSDGDGIFTINLTKRGVNKTAAKQMNAHAMGQSGYSLVYGKDASQHPYAEFCSYSDKWGKKAVNKVGTICRQIPFSDYCNGARLVADHYSYAVGISYGICSVLTFYTANLKYAGVDAELVRVAELATVVAWRKLYEGLGLSGYSAKASQFFDILRVATFSDKGTYIISKEGFPDYPANAKSGEEVLNASTKLIELAEIGHMPDAKAIMQAILAANQVRTGYSRLENAKKVRDNMVNRAALFGALRRIGQGKYGIDPMEEFSQEATQGMEDEMKPRSTYSIVKARGLHTQMQCPFLSEVLESAVDIHFELAKKYVQDEESEQFGF